MRTSFLGGRFGLLAIGALLSAAVVLLPLGHGTGSSISPSGLTAGSSTSPSPLETPDSVGCC